jgi:hypothetical protein
VLGMNINDVAHVKKGLGQMRDMARRFTQNGKIVRPVGTRHRKLDLKLNLMVRVAAKDPAGTSVTR